MIRQISALVAAGLPAHQAREICAEEISKLADAQLAQFELVWKIAMRFGGPVVLALNRIAEVFDRQHRSSQEIQLAFSGPQATAKLVMWLPVLALVLAQLVGLNPLSAILGSLLGALSVCLGAGLMVAGRYWTKRLLARALPAEHSAESLDRGAYLDCVLIGLQAGLPLSQARNECAEEFLVSFSTQPKDESFLALDAAAELSRGTGAALTEIISAKADSFRDIQKFETATRISKLGIHLMIPLGVAVLPAFVLLSIVPIAISLLSQGQL